MKAQRQGFWTVNWRYFWGVGVGLLIAWVTSVLAFFKAGGSSLPELIIFEVVLSTALLIVGLIVKWKEK